MMESLTRKLGPLPVYVWGLLLGLILVAGMYWQRSRQAVQATAPATRYPDLIPSQGGGDDDDDSPPSYSDYVSNDTWLKQAVLKLQAIGKAPLAAQLALQKYLSGRLSELTDIERAMVDEALSMPGLGLPPNPPSQVPTGPTPPPATEESISQGLWRAQGSGAVYEVFKRGNTWYKKWISEPEFAQRFGGGDNAAWLRANVQVRPRDYYVFGYSTEGNEAPDNIRYNPPPWTSEQPIPH